jgi:Skp family chaperone for outer membrane proteins
MKSKLLASVCLLCVMVLFLSYEYSSAQSIGPLSKIGIVDIERVSLECNATKTYMDKAQAELQKVKDEQNKIKAAIQALETELDSGALKVGSQEFFTKNRELAQKKAEMTYRQDFDQQELGLKNQLWKMDLYKKILKVTNDVGKSKDLYLVLAVEEPELTEQKVEEFPTIVRTHKVLYSGGCVDVTNEVIAKLNQETAAK